MRLERAQFKALLCPRGPSLGPFPCRKASVRAGGPAVPESRESSRAPQLHAGSLLLPGQDPWEREAGGICGIPLLAVLWGYLGKL